MSTIRIPWFLLLLDGIGAVVLIIGFLAGQGFDLGLPLLESIWPLLIILGLGMMAPMVAWVVRLALEKKRQRLGPGN